MKSAISKDGRDNHCWRLIGLGEIVEFTEKTFILCISRVKTPTSKRSVGGIFQSGGVESPPDSPVFQLAETSSLVLILDIYRRIVVEYYQLENGGSRTWREKRGESILWRSPSAAFR